MNGKYTSFAFPAHASDLSWNDLDSNASTTYDEKYYRSALHCIENLYISMKQ